MFIEACLISYGLHVGNKMYKKIKSRINKTNSEPEYKERLGKLAGSVNKMETGYQKFVQKKIDPIFGDLRGCQLETLSLTEDPFQISEEEKKANRRMGLAYANMGLAVVSAVFYPPLLIATAPVILWLCTDFFREAFHSLFKEHRFSISVVDSILTIWVLLSGYFFAGSVSMVMFTLHKKLLSKTKERSQRRLINVFGQHPRSVWILADGAEVEVPFEQLRAGDLFVVNTGEVVPADGTIKKGMASIDNHVLTGESQPAEKGVGEQVFASTVVLSGRICVLTEKAGEETMAAKLGEILNRTTNHKTSLESETEKIVDRSALPTLALSGLAYSVVGTPGGLGILTSAIGYNMRILGPMSTLNFLRIASQKGILIKDGRALEKLAKVDTVVFDKTGTLTLGQPYVNTLHSCNGLSSETLLAYAAAAEHRQKHPVAKAILAAAKERKLDLPQIGDARYEVGYGIRANLSDRLVRVGSERFMEMENIPIPADIKRIQAECGVRGYSLVMLAVDDEVAGAIELHPAIRPEAEPMVSQLRQSGISTCIISGDHEEPTRMLAWKLGIDHFYADTLPEQKAEIIEQLQKEGKTVCFVGDGINDSIALKKADVSVSLRGASTAALDSAQIVLMDESLGSLTRLLDISREFQANQKTNLVISVIPGVICIGGVFLFHFGIYTSMILFYLGLATGIGNVSRPLIRHKKNNRVSSTIPLP